VRRGGLGGAKSPWRMTQVTARMVVIKDNG